MQFIKPEWPAPLHIKAFTTTKLGWGEFIKKNNGFHTATSKEAQDLISLLHLPQVPIWIKQTHGTAVVEANPTNSEKEADASYSKKANQVCIVLTADCLPILLCHQKGHAVAAIHAGWRGLAAGIIGKTLQQLAEPSENFIAWLGPAIGPKHFEVGSDVFNAFVNIDPQAESAFKPHRTQKWLADLYQLASRQLKKLGVSQIYGGNYCTYSEENLFYSYRRDNKNTGRMASLIWIESK